MNEEKVREVLGFCYEQAHKVLSMRYPVGASSIRPFPTEVLGANYEVALEQIESKIEELTDDDLGKD